MRLNGVVAPICTPFTGDGEVNHAALRSNLAKYGQTGLNGYVAAGSTGEAALLSFDERLKLFETVRGAADGKLLIAGAGQESLRETLRLIGAAAALGYDAALVLTPHYYRGQMARPETQIAYFRAVADASRIPVLVYNIPQNTGIDLAPEMVAQLSEHPNIAGVKESSADLNKVQSLLAAVPKSFPVLVGSSVKFHDCLRMGAVGGILGIANAAPRSTQLIYDCFAAGDVSGSGDAQQAIAGAAGVPSRYGIQGLKYAMDRKGYYGGPARLPLLPLNEQQRAEIELLFRGVGE